MCYRMGEKRGSYRKKYRIPQQKDTPAVFISDFDFVWTVDARKKKKKEEEGGIFKNIKI